MSGKPGSQCQLFQLHIDAYLDNELEAARADELREHLDHCDACSQELNYAKELHRAVVSLPLLDCSDLALEPVDRLYAGGSDKRSQQSTGRFWTALGGLIDTMPAPVRLGIPVIAALVLLLLPGREILLPSASSRLELADQSFVDTAADEYSPAEIRQALQDLELALDYLGQISERTEVMIQDRFLLRQLERSMNASFTRNPDNDAGNGPI